MQTSSESSFSSPLKLDESQFIGRKWLFPKIIEWLNNPVGSRYFLIVGKAGTGKTSIASHLKKISDGEILSDKLKKDFLAASYFCTASDNRSTIPNVFSKSVTDQVMIKYPSILEKYLSHLGIQSKTTVNVSQTDISANNVVGLVIKELHIHEIDHQSIFERIFLGLVKLIISDDPKKKLIILIDALDESFRNYHHTSIISLISNLEGLSNNIRFLITSRDESKIIDCFANATTLNLSDNLELNKEDIKQYISSRLTKPQIHNLYEGFLDDLTEKSNGNFLYVKLLLDAVEGGEFIPTRENIGSLLPGLDGIYHQFLLRIKIRNEERWKTSLLPIFHTLCISFEGLTESHLATILRVPTYELRNHLGELISFMNVENIHSNKGEMEKKYSLYHHSLIDFFITPQYTSYENDIKFKKDNIFHISVFEAHRLIVIRFYNSSLEKIDIDKLDDYSLKYIINHLYGFIDYTDFEDVNWYKVLLSFLDDQQYLKYKEKILTKKSDSFLRVLKIIYDAAFQKRDVVSMIKIVLLLQDLVKYNKINNPINIINKNNRFQLDPKTLEESLNNSNLYEHNLKFIWRLLLSFTLKNSDKMKECKEILDGLGIDKDLILSKHLDIAAYFLADLCLDFPSNVKEMLRHFDEHQFESLLLSSKYHHLGDLIDLFIIGDNDKRLIHLRISRLVDKGEISTAIDISSSMDDPYPKALALSAIAVAQANSEDYDYHVAEGTLRESINFASTIYNPEDYFSSLLIIVERICKIPKFLVNLQLIFDLISLIPNDKKCDALILVMVAQLVHEKFVEFRSTMIMFINVLMELKGSTDEISIFFRGDQIYDQTENCIVELIIAMGSIRKLVSTSKNIDFDIIDLLDEQSKIRSILNIAISQAQNGDFGDAVKTASAIEDSYIKSAALSKIVSGEISSNSHVFFNKILENIEDPILMIQSLKRITLLIAQDGEIQKSKDLFDYAKIIVLNRNIQSPLYHISSIAVLEASLGFFFESRKTFQNILEKNSVLDPGSNRDINSSKISSDLILYGDLDLSSETVSIIDDHRTKSEALSRIALAMFYKKGFNVAKSIFDDSIKSASMIVEVDSKSVAISRVCSELILIEEYDYAYENILNIPNSNFNATPLKELVNAKIRIHDFESAIKFANKISHIYTRIDTPSSIAISQAQNGDFGDAVNTLEKFRSVLNYSLTMSSIALINFRKGKVEYKKIFENAIRALLENEKVSDKSEPVAKIIDYILEIPDVSYTLKIVKHIQNPIIQARSLIKIATIQFRCDSLQALLTLYNAYRKINEINDTYEKVNLITEIAKKYKEFNLVIEANQALIRAIIESNQIHSEYYKNLTLHRIFNALLMLKNSSTARTLPAHVTNDTRSKMLSDLAKFQFENDSVQEYVNTLKNLIPIKPEDVFNLLSSGRFNNKIMMDFLFEICYTYPHIISFMVTYISMGNKEHFNAIIDLIVTIGKPSHITPSGL